MKKTGNNQSVKSPKSIGKNLLNLKALQEENSEANRGRSMLIVEMVELSKTKTSLDFIELLSAQIVAADGNEQSPEFGALREGLSSIKAGLAELYRIQAMHKLRLSFLPMAPDHSVMTF